MNKISNLLVAQYFTVSVLVLTLSGCRGKEQDVTNDPSFGNFGASMVGIYRTTVPTKLIKGVSRDLPSATLWLIYDGPSDEEWKTLAGIPVGTEVRIERLIYRDTFERPFLFVIGKVTSGEHAGKAIAFSEEFFPFTTMDKYRVWHGSPSTTKPAWTVEPDKLERIHIKDSEGIEATDGR